LDAINGRMRQQQNGTIIGDRDGAQHANERAHLRAVDFLPTEDIGASVKHQQFWPALLDEGDDLPKKGSGLHGTSRARRGRQDRVVVAVGEGNDLQWMGRRSRQGDLLADLLKPVMHLADWLLAGDVDRRALPDVNAEPRETPWRAIGE